MVDFIVLSVTGLQVLNLPIDDFLLINLLHKNSHHSLPKLNVK